jgi:scyllo-inositol 2-dehydrogenase (NADP+)
VSGAPSEQLRVALIGYGLAGQVFHGPLVTATPNMSVASVVTGDPDRQALATKQLPDVRVLPKVEALWERAAEHDLVVVAAPNRFHAPLGLTALEAGVPVVIDKPMAATAEDGRRLMKAAEDRGLMLTVFHNRRWDGDFLTVRRLLSEDVVGAIVRFESRFDRWRPAVQEGRWRERGDPAEAGGLLFDLGSHLIDQAVALFGPPERVYAEVDRRRPGAQVDDDAFVAIAHAGGIRSHLWMTFLAAAPGPRIRLLGTRGTYEKHGLDGQEEALKSGLRPGQGRWGGEPEDRWGTLTTGDGARPVETEPGAWPEFYRLVGEALRQGGPPPVPPGEAVAVLDVIEAAQRSADEGVGVGRG